VAGLFRQNPFPRTHFPVAVERLAKKSGYGLAGILSIVQGA
jgi:hypothetical protein